MIKYSKKYSPNEEKYYICSKYFKSDLGFRFLTSNKREIDVSLNVGNEPYGTTY